MTATVIPQWDPTTVERLLADYSLSKGLYGGPPIRSGAIPMGSGGPTPPRVNLAAQPPRPSPPTLTGADASGVRSGSFMSSGATLKGGGLKSAGLKSAAGGILGAAASFGGSAVEEALRPGSGKSWFGEAQPDSWLGHTLGQAGKFGGNTAMVPVIGLPASIVTTGIGAIKGSAESALGYTVSQAESAEEGAFLAGKQLEDEIVNQLGAGNITPAVRSQIYRVTLPYQKTVEQALASSDDDEKKQQTIDDALGQAMTTFAVPQPATTTASTAVGGGGQPDPSTAVGAGVQPDPMLARQQQVMSLLQPLIDRQRQMIGQGASSPEAAQTLESLLNMQLGQAAQAPYQAMLQQEADTRNSIAEQIRQRAIQNEIETMFASPDQAGSSPDYENDPELAAIMQQIGAK